MPSVFAHDASGDSVENPARSSAMLALDVAAARPFEPDTIIVALGSVLLEALSCSSGHQKNSTQHDGADSRPYGHADGLLVLYGQFHGPDLGLVSSVRIREAAVRQG